MTSFISTRNHYFSIPDIIATQERITCTFSRKVAFLGVLDPSAETTALDAGTVLELPYWLVRALIHDDSIELELPKVYRESYRDIFKADANVVDLYRLCKYFYEFGKLMSNLTDRRGSLDLCSSLIQVFIDRFRRLSDWAQNCDSDFSATDKFENYEKALLQRGKEAQDKLTSWLNEGVGGIKPSAMVDSYKKRKLLARELSS